MASLIPVKLIVLFVSLVIPAMILYFIIKAAIKNAIKELKNENIL